MKTTLIILAIASVAFILFFAFSYAGIGPVIVILGFITFLVVAMRDADKRKAQEETAWKARCAKSRK